MKLDEESKSAIAEIGNLCIAGGSNRIANFSKTLVDISVVESEIRSTIELLIEVNPSDDCKRLLKQKVSGDFTGEFLIQISNEVIQTILDKFSNLDALGAYDKPEEAIDRLMSKFTLGCIEGIAGMTDLDLKAEGKTEVCTDLDPAVLPEQVLSYRSIIYIGNDRLDFDVYFFADPVKVIPKILESLGM